MLHVDSRETAFEHQGMPVAQFNIFLSPNAISTYKFSKLISIHFLEELVERIW